MDPNAPVFVPSAALLKADGQAETNRAACHPGDGDAARGRGGNRQQFHGAGSSKARRRNNATDQHPRGRKPNPREELVVDEHGKIASHLLGFKYASPHTVPSGGTPRRGPRRGHTTPYSKERFMLANCQFVVRDGGNYNYERDALIDWDSVVQVRVFSKKEASCPICLGEPQAARITKCGHVYCWPCILHYLALGENNRKWRKCPVCNESVYAEALRSVQVIDRSEIEVGAKLSMRLMQRAKGSTAVMTRARWQPCSTIPYYTNDDAAGAFCTLLLVSAQDAVSDIVAHDRQTLQAQRTAAQQAGDTEDLPYIDQALAALDVAADALRHCIPSTPTPISQLSAPRPALPASAPTTDAPAYIHLHEPDHHAAPSATDSGLSLFFQAADGQRVYLHSLNVRCLLREFGSMEQCPDELAAPVLELEELTITDDTRKRYRYLAHLPLTSEFTIAELDLTDIVSADCLAHFADELKERTRRRKQKREKERAAQRKVERAQQQQARQQIDASDPMHFPAVSATYIADSLVLEPAVGVTATAPGSFSFAAAARTRGPASAPAPAPAPMPRTTTAVKFVPLGRPRAPSSGSDDEGLPAPTFQNSFSSALTEALRTRPRATDEAGKEGGQKSKKGKGKTLLFATTSQRRD